MSRDLETARIIDGVLKLVVVTGMVGGLILAPNAVKLGDIALKRLDKRSKARNARGLVRYMEKSGLVDCLQSTDGDMHINATKKGINRYTRAEFRDMNLAIPRVWDEKWRLVLFDIPETHRNSRKAFSAKLRDLGFYKLQRSAWIHPYECAKEVEIMQQVYQIPTRGIVVTEINLKDRENELREYFKIDT